MGAGVKAERADDRWPGMAGREASGEEILFHIGGGRFLWERVC
jgi:hypothetical protein